MNTKKTRKNTKKKNPLYIVTNKGKDIQEAKGIFDIIIKKLGLEEALKILLEMFNSLWEMLCKYGAIGEAKKLVDQWNEALQKLLAPLAFFKA